MLDYTDPSKIYLSNADTSTVAEYGWVQHKW